MPKGHRQTRSHPALQGCTRTGIASPAKQTSKQINKTRKKPPFSVDAQLISRNIMETGWGAHEWWLLTHPQLPKPPRSLWIYSRLGSQCSRGRAGCPQKVGDEAQRPPREEPSTGSRHSTAETRSLDVFWRFPTPGAAPNPKPALGAWTPEPPSTLSSSKSPPRGPFKERPCPRRTHCLIFSSFREIPAPCTIHGRETHDNSSTASPEPSKENEQWAAAPSGPVVPQNITPQ